MSRSRPWVDFQIYPLCLYFVLIVLATQVLCWPCWYPSTNVFPQQTRSSLPGLEYMEFLGALILVPCSQTAPKGHYKGVKYVSSEGKTGQPSCEVQLRMLCNDFVHTKNHFPYQA